MLGLIAGLMPGGIGSTITGRADLNLDRGVCDLGMNRQPLAHLRGRQHHVVGGQADSERLACLPPRQT